MLAVENEVEDKIQKLIKIKKATGWSQEKLAREMGVSIQTSHNWLNYKTTPKSENQIASIDRFIGKNAEYLKSR